MDKWSNQVVLDSSIKPICVLLDRPNLIESRNKALKMLVKVCIQTLLELLFVFLFLMQMPSPLSLYYRLV